MKKTKSIIGIPMGDPAGIGPEIVVKSLFNKVVYEYGKPLVIGNRAVLKNAMNTLGINIPFNVISNPSEGKYEHGVIDIIEVISDDLSSLKMGIVQAEAGKAAFDCIKVTTELAIAKKIDVMATTPINKESFKAANIPFIGHTEVLEALTGVKNPLTMFQVYDLRVFFYSRHVSLRKACELIKKEEVLNFIKRCNNASLRLGIEHPKIAVAGLNPHCGEHGLFGDEEIAEIEPAIELAKKEGIDVCGPVSADSVFYQGLKGKYDVVLSLYHDQGHIATKMVDFERTISLTNNMPFLRTSVDHGTAFDIAGTGKASAVSMEEAIRLAALYAPKFNS